MANSSSGLKERSSRKKCEVKANVRGGYHELLVYLRPAKKPSNAVQSLPAPRALSRGTPDW